jgi:hypothetical protein
MDLLREAMVEKRKALDKASEASQGRKRFKTRKELFEAEERLQQERLRKKQTDMDNQMKMSSSQASDVISDEADPNVVQACLRASNPSSKERQETAKSNGETTKGVDTQAVGETMLQVSLAGMKDTSLAEFDSSSQALVVSLEEKRKKYGSPKTRTDFENTEDYITFWIKVLC